MNCVAIRSGQEAPSQLEDAAKRIAGLQSDDDGMVVSGQTGGAESGWGRYWLLFTGFPFPLGPLFARQTVRHEVHLEAYLYTSVLCELRVQARSAQEAPQPCVPVSFMQCARRTGHGVRELWREYARSYAFVSPLWHGLVHPALTCRRGLCVGRLGGCG